MDKSGIIDALAQVVVGAGLRTERGDLVVVDGAPIHRDFMLAAARECWARGARHVYLRYYDDRAFRDRVDREAEEWLDTMPRALESFYKAFADEGWSRLMVVGDEDPSFMEGADPGRLQRVNAAHHRAFTPLSNLAMSFTIPWCVVPYPTDAWARLVQASPDAMAEALWPELLKAMRIDGPSEEGPRTHFDALAERARILDSLHLESLEFSGPGTALTIGLSSRSRWMGGTVTAPGGRSFTPNIPTEEVYTTPDFRRTEGHVACSRPVVVLDTIVEGAWLEFKGGVVVASGASRNAEVLDRNLAIDQGARRLGEVALVDCSSPIWTSGRLFRNILLDENAACHIALGHGIASTFEGAGRLDAEAREAAGYNDSSEHSDLMIGSDRVDVTGWMVGGGEVALIREGRFVI